MTCSKWAVGWKPPATKTMLELQRLTTEYIELEDRIRLTGEDQQGGALCLWLTQRLALRLVAHLVEAIATASPEAMKNPSQDQDVSKLLQGMAQQAAAADLSPEAAVQSDAATQSLLINEVDINRAANGLIGLVFKEGTETEVALSFELQKLRQWLAIIYSQWTLAEWPSTVWPEWMGAQPQVANLEEPSDPLH